MVTTDGAGNLSFTTPTGGGFDPNVDNPTIGNGASAGTDSVAVGHDAVCTGSDSVVIGNNVAGGTNSRVTGIGSDVIVSGADATAYGHNANAAASCTAVGTEAQALNSLSCAFGNGADALAGSSVAVGYNSSVSSPSTFGVAVGRQATVGGGDGVAIGYLANAGAANTLHINATGAGTNAPTATGDIEIESSTGRLTWDSSATNWLVRGGNLHVEDDIIAFSTTISDERLKSDITEIDSALDKVDALRGVTFTYHDGRESAGVIAQDVEAVLPQAVSEHTVPLMTGDDETEYKTVNYDALIGLLVESVKELRAEVKALKGE